MVFQIPNTFCVFEYHNYHDKTQQINFCYLFVSKLQVKCSLSYYAIIIIHVLSQFQQLSITTQQTICHHLPSSTAFSQTESIQKVF